MLFRSGEGYESTDWYNEVVRPWAPQQQYNLNVRGGTDKARYFASLGYLNEGGIWRSNSSNFQRFNTLPFSSDLSPAMHVGNLAKTISTHESLAGQKFIGQSGNTYNSYCSAKDMTAWGLGAFRGLCPEEPTKRGGYYAASVAYYGRTTDLSTAQGEQKLSTYAVALTSPQRDRKSVV